MDIADTDSARQHFAELSESNNAIHSSVMETGTKLTSQGYTVYYAVGTQTVAKFKDDISDANLVEVRIFIIRIPLHDADIIISVNSPIKIAPRSSSQHCSPTDPAANSILADAIISSFSIENLSLLFG
eukprot:CRZ01992.1 hypothetical protein [Spongospora subterranea]